MIIRITIAENPLAPRPVFVVAYVKAGRTGVVFLPQVTTFTEWLEYSVLEEEAKSVLSVSPEGAWAFDNVKRVIVFAMTESGYPSSPASKYTVENHYGPDEYRDHEDPPAGVTLSAIPVKTGLMVLADFDIVEDNSRQAEGPVFKDISEAMLKLGLPAAFAA